MYGWARMRGGAWLEGAARPEVLLALHTPPMAPAPCTLPAVALAWAPAVLPLLQLLELMLLVPPPLCCSCWRCLLRPPACQRCLPPRRPQPHTDLSATTMDSQAL